MPRRNYRAVQDTTRRHSPTHLLIHVSTGRSYAFGSKAEMVERMDLNNAVEACQAWKVVPIHK